MKIILIHGIGENNPGWAAALKADRILDVAPDRIVEFHYDDLMSHTWLNRLLVATIRRFVPVPKSIKPIKPVEDYVNDILMYFIIPGIRPKILERLAGVLRQHPAAIVIGFSLGSIVAYETVKNFPAAGDKPTLITIGSPLGSPPLSALVKRFMKVPDTSRPAVKDWYNIYGTTDILSGRITGLGCKSQDQFKVSAGHDMATYLKRLKAKLPHLFL